jgi:hypothetical protein
VAPSIARSENKTAAVAADMVFAYITRSPATGVVPPKRNRDAIRGPEMAVKHGLIRIRKIRKMGLHRVARDAR